MDFSPPMTDPTSVGEPSSIDGDLETRRARGVAIFRETLGIAEVEKCEASVFYLNAHGTISQPDESLDVVGAAPCDNCSTDFVQIPSHDGYVCLSDIALDNTLRVPPSETQTPCPLSNGERSVDAQDGENPTNYRSLHCVPAGYDAAGDCMHANVLDFELWMQDVQFTRAAGHVEEPNTDLGFSTSQRTTSRMPSEPTHCQRRLQIVRRWLSNHASRPYPTPTEKIALATSAGCSEHQLNICFRNLRAREKYLFDGNTNIRNGSITTDPELHDSISAYSGYPQPGFVDFCHNVLSCSVTSPPVTNTSDSSSWLSPSDPGYPTPDHSQDTETQVYQHPAAESVRQEAFSVSALRGRAVPKRKGRRFHAQRHQYGTSEHLPVAPQQTPSTPSVQEPENKFPCTVCVKAFKNASDWKRHEASVHGYNDREWVCMLTGAFKLQSECVFCLEPMDSTHHLNKHAIDPCSTKCTAERSFPRKDLLRQHVLLAHLKGAPPSVKKTFEVPTEWSRGLDVSPGGPGSRWCGFCGCMRETTADRMDHIAQHFRNGQKMTSWIRM